MRARSTGASRKFAVVEEEKIALHKCLLFIEAFRAIHRIMPLQHAYVFLFVALEEGRSVSEYAKRAGITQAVMTRILFALGSRHRGRRSAFGLVQQSIDPEDLRKHQTFLTANGKALRRVLVRLIRSERQHAIRRRLLMVETSPRDLARDQWLSRLIAGGRKLRTEDIQLAVRQLELLIDHRQSKRSPVRSRRP